MRHLIQPLDLSFAETNALVALGEDISHNKENYTHLCDGKKLASLFYEPSTRTRLSFESAMLSLGGSVLGFASADTSSASKGESVADTIRIISSYADICAMRHPLEGAPLRASRFSTIPVINAGDGGHEHPTQTLTDLLTIQKRKGRLDHLKVGFCGDLKYGRTVHSLMTALARNEGNEFVLISPEELKVPARFLDSVAKTAHVKCTITDSLEDSLAGLDILYMTRIQKERFSDLDEYARLKDIYVLDIEKMENAPADMAVLHPLPRVNEISLAVDSDPRAAYFEQAQNGVYMRMALILSLLGLAPAGPLAPVNASYVRLPEITGKKCKNERCITSTEQEIDRKYTRDTNGEVRCIYCSRTLHL